MLGRAISHYVIQQKIGQGGMGEVYLARDTELDRTVALKILPAQTASDENRLRRFIQEAKAASALNHPGICVIHEIGRTEEKQPFIVMEYVDGKTLRSMLNSHPIALEEMLGILIGISDALDEAHSKGIIHRDIKPENIMVTSRGQAKILDFGLAKIATNEMDLQSQMATETGTIMGTFYYMSPEQASGQKVDHRSDIFSLGVLMYEMSTGRLPFSGKNITEVLLQIVQAEPPDPLSINPALPPGIKEIIRKCIAKKPEDRYQSARELVSDLKRLQKNSGSMSTIYSAPPKLNRKIGSSALLIAAAVVLTAIAMIVYMKSGKSVAHSIAVLPFANQSHDPDTEYLSDGITESIINHLSQLPQLRVMARSTVFSYKGKAEDPGKIGKELKVDAVASGSITQHGNTIIVQADLMNVSDRTQIWGEQYTRNISDVLALQSEISKEISENLRLKLTGAQQQVVTKQYTTDPEAYRFYLQGRYHWYKFTDAEQRLSIDYFQKAIAKDPGYAQAYAGLADAYSARCVNGWSLPREGYPKARAAAQKSLQLDPQLPEGHNSYAAVLFFYDRAYLKAIEEFRTSIQLSPNKPDSYDLLSYPLGATGKTDEAIVAMRRAVELDPLNAAMMSDLGWALMMAKRYPESVEILKKSLELDPTFEGALDYLSYTYASMGQYDLAIVAAKKAVEVSQNSPIELAALGFHYGMSGNHAEAEKVLSQLEEQSKQTYISPYFLGLLHAGLGENDQAFPLFLKACNDRTGDWGLDFIKMEPFMDKFRSDPRYNDLLKCMGF